MAVRALLTIFQETLGQRHILKYFPSTTNPADPLGNAAKLSEFISSALWWLGNTAIVTLVDSTTYTLPASGVIDLGFDIDNKVLKLIRVRQNGITFPKARADWGTGSLVFKGAWTVQDRTFYALSMIDKSQFPASVPYSSIETVGSPAFTAGAIEFHYYGVPTEAQLAENFKFRRAVLNYATHLAYQDMITRAMRDKRIVFEGIPEIWHNIREMRVEANKLLEQAEEAISGSYVTTL